MTETTSIWKPSWLIRIDQWRKEHVPNKQFTLALSLAVGFFAAVAAYVLHWLIDEIQLLLTAGMTILI